MNRPPAGEAVTEFRKAFLAIQPHADIGLIGHAYDVAAQCHQGQKRYSGDPYITHPVAVAVILAGLGIADDQMLCALMDPAGQVPLLSRAVPAFGQLLAGYNAALPPQRRLRVRVALHAGPVRDDDNGCFGMALDIACRLLDAPEAKAVLKTAPGPLLLVVSDAIYRSVVSRGPGGTGRGAFRRLVTVQVAGREHPGWIWAPARAA